MPTHDASQQAGEDERRVGLYIYGIVPGDVESVPDVQGIGDPPGDVTLVRHDTIAAMVSEIDLDKPIGKPADLKLHEQLLDATAAADVPVLPMRFGAVMSSAKAVREELLAPQSEVFSDALRELDGRAEYVVHGRFVEDEIMSRVVSENPEVAERRDRLRGTDPQTTREERIALGEIINKEIDARRARETEKLIDALESVTLAEAVRSPSSDLDAYNVAFLVELDREGEFEDAVAGFAEAEGGLVNVRLRGPLAAYDFIVAKKPSED